MDETCFIECKVKNCTLIYCGGPHLWIDSTFDNCVLRFDADALNVIRYLNEFGKLTEVFSKEMGLDPTKDPAIKTLEDELGYARTIILAVQSILEVRSGGFIDEIKGMIKSYFTKGASGSATGEGIAQ